MTRRELTRRTTGAIVFLTPLTIAWAIAAARWPAIAWIGLGIAVAPLVERAFVAGLLAAMLGPRTRRPPRTWVLLDGTGRSID